MKNIIFGVAFVVLIASTRAAPGLFGFGLGGFFGSHASDGNEGQSSKSYNKNSFEEKGGALQQLSDQQDSKDDCSCPPKPMDCDEVMQCGNNSSGIYKIWPRNRVMVGSTDVYCDMQTSGGGWTIIQRRGDYKKPTDFFLKSWHSYKKGFGDLQRGFWLGNDNIYALTNQKKYYLRIELTDHSNNTRVAFYDQFWIDGEHHHYMLHAHDYSGDAGDALSRTHDGQKFSTIDRDNDNSTYQCAQKHKGGWWFGDCQSSNLNGMYNNEKVKSADGIIWSTWRGSSTSLKMTEMKIRPADFKAGVLDLNIDAV